MTAEDSTLDDVRRELYGGSLATFVERRKELANAARSGGDRDQAKHIEKMRKPSAAVHLVNLLAQAEDSSLFELVELGESIRSAIAEGDDRTIRSLLRSRPAAIAKTAAQAQEVARASGESVSGAITDQIVQILRAAMASDDAAAAVRTGTLTDALDEPGLEAFSIESAARAPLPTRSGRVKAQRKPDVAVDREAQQTAERPAAQARIKSAAAEVKRADKALADATKHRDGLRRDRDRLALQLAQIDAELTAVQEVVDDAEAQLTGAAAEMEAASEAAPH
jgi:hypothetical protein